MSIHNLDSLFRARSLAVVGASADPSAVGGIIVRNLAEAGFAGELHLVNPKYDEIGGRPCHRGVATLPDGIDCAVVSIPAPAVPSTIETLAKKVCRSAVVITAGLGSGPGSLKQAMLDAARPLGTRIVGPNCLGVAVPGTGMNATFAQSSPMKGDLALISQSGAIVTTLIDWANDRRIGFSGMVSLGDMAEVDFGDLLDWFALDPNTRAILLYVEAITRPKKFMSAARAAARSKPVVVIKSGRHAAAAKAAASHTGALAGVDEVYDAAFRRAGLLRVDDLDELFDAAETLSRVKPFRGDRVSVLTNGGGIGVIAVDRLLDERGTLSPLSPDTIAALDAVLPPTWSRGNPVDIVGDAGPDRYAAALEVLLNDKSTDAILVMNCPTALASSSAAAEAVAETVREQGRHVWPRKPVFAAWLGGQAADATRPVFEAAGVPHFASPTAAVRGVTHLVRYSSALEALMQTPPSLPREFTPNVEAARSVIAEALSRGQSWLSSRQRRRIFEAYHVPVIGIEGADTPEQAGDIAARLLREHEAVAVKIRSPDIQHKSDVGGVRLGMTSRAAAEQAARDVIDAARAAVPTAHIEGVTVEPMVERPAARELIVGLTDDETFGPMVLFGAGGIAVETLRDKALALPPLDLTLARDLIAQTRISRLLNAYRNQPAADLDGIALTLVKIAQMTADLPEIRELDINPLLADEHGVLALDSRIRVEAETHRGRHGVNPRFSISPYPSEWEREIVLSDASAVEVRPVRPEDEPLFEEFFSRVSPEDMRLRFFTPHPDLSHRFLARLTQIDYARAMAFVALTPATGEMLGAVRIHADADHVSGEYAIMVRSDLKGKGLGWELMKLIIDYARADGIKEITGDVLRQNETMLAMCRELGFAEIHSREDPGVVQVRLRLDRPARD
ncbi:bifunctional acetate--CoA ligase family protein/GNAT family N-acetyltransferase [Lutibaculum baratangense]|uniref:Putative Acetyl-CoA synthetase (ADP-forming) alpha and beta chains n=1 Tax=Lutibaculum baratangense AMV1 TaxID=631454 RepID=V4TKX2_9HYPH|nr:bifunctional acetate--CoA ligase family protein/GNAT family N-acetyltransferase [Lutibaculum baratangense]ESR26468.1 putative Acetyl-CoA synthetase (ADP-forming) alpha and beta chains [Lutibaculum baratangense AMV1]